MILSCSNIQKSFGAEEILKNVSFMIEDKEKAAIIGVNGAGKSTLFRIITQEISKDAGEVIIPKDKKIGYFEQNLTVMGENTIYGELISVFDDIISAESEMRNIEEQMSGKSVEELELLMSKYSSLSNYIEKNNGYEYQSRIRGVIKGLGFSPQDYDTPVNRLSGGEKTRVALGKLLLSTPDILLLDEPTNHLDMDSVNWLEDYIKSYPSAVIVVSHDRYFIDKTVSKIIEIENGRSTVYNGSYTAYSEKKQTQREIDMHRYLSEQQEIKRQEEVIKKLRSFNREKSIKRAESREKALEKMEKTERPENLPDKMRLILKPKKESGNDVLSVKNVGKSFDGTNLFRNVSFEVKKRDKIALIGANGIGKTTLFRIILGKLTSEEGCTKLGANVTIGYYDQEHQTLNDSKTIFDEIYDTYPDMTVDEIRNALAAFVFTGDDVFKEISSLSGGEKGRVALAKIMLSNANFLILDEPTNHLDIVSKEILENALRNYSGTYLYISHDRYFINNTAEKILELKNNGIKEYLGNYDYYIEQKAAEANTQNTTLSETEQKKENENKNDWQKQKQLQSENRKKETLLKKTESEIEKTESEIAECEEMLMREDISTDVGKLNEIYSKKEKLEKDLELLYEKWDSLT